MNTEIVMVGLAAFLVAGIVKGTIGMGLPTTLVSLMTQFIDPRVAIALLLIPAIVTNAWQVFRAGDVLTSIRQLWPFTLVMMLTIWPATQVAAQVSAQTMTLWVGVMVVVFAALSLLRAPPEIPAHFDRPAQIIAGGLAGVIGGMTSIWSPPMVIYLIGRRVNKEEFIRYAGFIILAGTFPLTAGYWRAGLFDQQLALLSLLMVVPVLLGFTVGERLRKRLNAELFRKGVLVFFFLMGLNLIRRALF